MNAVTAVSSTNCRSRPGRPFFGGVAASDSDISAQSDRACALGRGSRAQVVEALELAFAAGQCSVVHDNHADAGADLDLDDLDEPVDCSIDVRSAHTLAGLDADGQLVHAGRSRELEHEVGRE